MFHARISFIAKISDRLSAVIGGLITAAIIASSTGCQQYASYPPVEVAANLQRPPAEPVPTIMAQTVRYAREHYKVSEELPLNLPENTPQATYDRVFTHLRSGRPMQAGDALGLHITAIRVRGMRAQVDLIYPTLNGFHHFVTVNLAHDMFKEWEVKSDHPWALGGVAPPPPHYAEAPASNATSESNN